MNQNCFMPANILLPKSGDMSRWAVVACDQFSAQPDYWERVASLVGSEPSTYHITLPEALLGTAQEAEHSGNINKNMAKYLEEQVFAVYENAYLYVERTMENGTKRKGLVGAIDLESYDFSQGSTSSIRATEHTDVNRVIPRVAVRRNACLELPHVMVLLDDHKKCLIESIGDVKETLPVVYDLDLMEQGGHITGWLVQGEVADQFDQRLADYAKTVGEKYQDLDGTPMVFAMGDGNHSLATAKACLEEMKAAQPHRDFSGHPASKALVEIGNIHDEAQVFEPIHRVVFGTDPQKLLTALRETACGETGYEIQWFMGEESGTVVLDGNKSPLAMGVLQPFLDEFLAENQGEQDYIHGDQACMDLAKTPNAIGFLVPAMEKSQLFRGVIADGVLPRKTFSMGHAQEKRYYMECRKIAE